MDDEIYVYFQQLPDGFSEAIMPCQTGYTIYIDPRQSDDGIKRSYEHAMSHIRNHDFEKEDVQQIEYEAHYHKKGD